MHHIGILCRFTGDNTGLTRFIFSDQNFIMASGLLVEYMWLLGVILISLLIDGNQIASAIQNLLAIDIHWICRDRIPHHFDSKRLGEHHIFAKVTTYLHTMAMVGDKTPQHEYSKERFCLHRHFKFVVFVVSLVSSEGATHCSVYSCWYGGDAVHTYSHDHLSSWMA